MSGPASPGVVTCNSFGLHHLTTAPTYRLTCRYRFQFDGVFDESVGQEDVFSAVASDAVDAVLAGFNACVFAFGQTGSGKTFTITGGAERYADRGIIPRALGRLFDAFASRSGDASFAAGVSYMEIYNETGYDLLGAIGSGSGDGSVGDGAGGRGLEELPRVTVLEDEAGGVHCRGLGVRPVSSESDALSLLFLGDTNRAIAETPLNPASTRSHCVFTLHVEARNAAPGAATVTRSKLHLVDLAGSERTGKTGASGLLFREATHINRSLHYLEMVIGALGERGRTHVPYRNSLMTSLLRDSLGGNCRTTMVATLSPEPEHTDESLCTCRFAARVGRVTNAAVVNAALDPAALVPVLRGRLAALEAQVAFLKAASGDSEDSGSALAVVSPDDRAGLARDVEAWLLGPPEGCLPVVPLTPPRVRVVLELLRERIGDAQRQGEQGEQGKQGAGGALAAPQLPAAAAPGVGPSAREVAQLRSEVGRLKAALIHQQMTATLAAGPQLPPPLPLPLAMQPSPPPVAMDGPLDPAQPSRMPQLPPHSSRAPLLLLPDGSPVTEALLRDREAALAAYRACWRSAGALADNEALGAARYASAKEAAEALNACRDAAVGLKGAIERRRMARAVAGIGATEPGLEGAAAAPHGEEEALVARLTAAKGAYKAQFDGLKALKTELEGIQRVSTGLRSRCKAEFDGWYTRALLQAAAEASSGAQRHRAGADEHSLAASAVQPAQPPAVEALTTARPARPPTPLGQQWATVVSVDPACAASLCAPPPQGRPPLPSAPLGSTPRAQAHYGSPGRGPLPMAAPLSLLQAWTPPMPPPSPRYLPTSHGLAAPQLQLNYPSQLLPAATLFAPSAGHYPVHGPPARAATWPTLPLQFLSDAQLTSAAPQAAADARYYTLPSSSSGITVDAETRSYTRPTLYGSATGTSDLQAHAVSGGESGAGQAAAADAAVEADLAAFRAARERLAGLRRASSAGAASGAVPGPTLP